MTKWQAWSVLLLPLAANCAAAATTYPSAANPDRPAIYQRVDLSFSDIAIDTPFAEVASRLTMVPAKDYDCQENQDCDYRDADGVRHYFWSNLDDYVLVIKIVQASEFTDRPISALGIGMAREKPEVLANVRSFQPGLELDCDPAHVSTNVGPDECSASVGEGWFQIGFDLQGRLQAVRFDGYQFT